MSPIRLCILCAMVAFCSSFTFANNNPGKPSSSEGDVNEILTPDCSLTSAVDFLDCDELKVSWSEAGNPMSVEIRVLIAGIETDVIQTYGNSYSIYYLQNMTLQIRPFVFAPAEPCPWEDLTIPTNPFSSCNNCIQSYLPTAFQILPVQDGSCQNFVVVCDVCANLQINSVWDEQNQSAMNFTFNSVTRIISITDPVSPYSIYSFDFAFVNGFTQLPCQSALAVNTDNCDGTGVDLALTVTGNNTGLSMGADHVMDVNVFNQSNEFVDPVYVSIFLPTEVIAGNNPTWLSAGSGEYITAVNILPNETLTIPFHFTSNQTGQFEIIGEISDMNGLDDVDSYPDDDTSNDTYLGDDIIDQDGKNGGDEDDHDKYLASFTQDYYDLALTITSPVSTIVAGNTVTYTVNVYNQGTVAVDHPEIAIQIPENSIMEGGVEFEQSSGAGKFFYTMEQNIPAGGQASFTFDVVTYPADVPTLATEAIAEVNFFKDFANAPGSALTNDTDSSPDDILNNDSFGGNDIIDNSNGDEDDHDEEALIITTLPSDLPNLTCGQVYTPTSIGNFNKVAIAVGSIIWMNDFPFKVATISSGGSSLTYSGTGYMSMPFLHEDTKLMIDFTGVEVADIGGAFHAFSGQVMGQKKPNQLLDDLQDFPVFSCSPSDEQENGGDEERRDRQYDENGIDQWGFDQNGKYKKPPYPGWEEGDPYDEDYDPNGFDKDGNHRSGGKYNDCGCDQEGNHRDGGSCDPDDCNNCPYYWISPESCETEEGVTFFNDIDDFDQEVEGSTTEVKNQLDSDISGQRANCNNVRTQMDPIIADHDAFQIKGGTNEPYYAEDMNENFISPPERFASQSSTRDQSLIELQNLHVDLYECDLELSKMKDREDFLDNMSPEKEQELKDAMEAAIKQFTAEESDLYSDETEFEQWKQSFINNWVDEQMNEDVVMIIYPSFNTGYANTASMDGAPIPLHPEDVLLEYLNDHKDIYGIDRNYLSHYLALRQDSRRRQQQLVTGNTYDFAYEPFVIEDDPVNGVFQYVFVDDVLITPTSAMVDVTASITETKMGQTVFFEASNVPILPSGFDMTSPLAENNMIKLELAQNTAIQFNNTTRINLLSKNGGHPEGTYITFNCNGFGKVLINGNAQLCESFFIELDENYEPTGNDVFTTEFRVGPIDSWSEFMADLDMGNFAINGLNNVRFTLDHLVLDHHETESHPTFQAPDNSSGNYGADWQGLFIKDISVVIEKEMRASGDLKKITGHNILIDGAGFSGKMEYMENGSILTMGASDIDGWGLSIESFYLDILSHQMNRSGVGIKGKMDLPLFKDHEENYFLYDASIDFNKVFTFQMSLPQKGTLEVPILFGHMLLNSPTGAKLKYENDAFKADATIAGKLSISKEKGEEGAPTKMSLLEIKLPTLELNNHTAPHLRIKGQIGDSKQEIELGGFGLSIKKMDLGEDQNGNNLFRFDLELDLLKEDISPLKAVAGMVVKGRLNTLDRHRWEFRGVSLDQVCIAGKGNFSKFKGISGCLNWFDEGKKGFEGEGLYGLLGIDGLALTKNSEIDLGLHLGFIRGKTSSEVNYYLFDLGIDKNYGAEVPFKEGINLKDLSVMYAKNLSRSTLLSGNPNSVNFENYSLENNLSGYKFQVAEGHNSFNGTLGLVSSLKESLFNFYGSFGLSMDGDGAVQSLNVGGAIRAFSEPQNSEDPGEVSNQNRQFSGRLNMNIDSDGIEASGDLGISMNVDKLKLDVAGTIPFGFGFRNSGGYYFKFGEPEPDFDNIGARNGIKIDMPDKPGISTEISGSTYFHMGTYGLGVIPPLPPEFYAAEEGGSLLDAESQYATGAGVLFGAKAKITRTWGKCGLACVQAEAGAGFDVALIQTDGLFCFNSSGLTGGVGLRAESKQGQIGVDGWYAAGQIYALVRGRAKALGITVLEVFAGLALQAKLPNPLYARGIFTAGYKNWLGKKKSITVDLELGEECEVVGGDPATIEFLKFIDFSNPFDKQIDIYPGIYPRFFLKYKQTENVRISGETYQVELLTNSVKLKSDGNFKPWEYTKSNGLRILSVGGVESNGKTIELDYPGFMPEDQEIIFSADFKVTYPDGSEEVKKETISFYTRSLPNRLDVSNISSVFPIPGMANFYKNEFSHPFQIKLKRWRRDLFGSTLESPEGHATIKIGGGYQWTSYEVDFDYGENTINIVGFDPSILKANTNYEWRLEYEFDNNVYILFSAVFRVSKYNTFDEKIQSMVIDQLSDATALEDHNGIIEFELEEGFGRYEILKRWVKFSNWGAADWSLPGCEEYNLLVNGLQYNSWNDLFDPNYPDGNPFMDYLVVQNPTLLNRLENNHPLDFLQIIQTGQENKAGFEFKYDKLPQAVHSQGTHVDLSGQKMVFTMVSSMVKDRNILCELLDCNYYYIYSQLSGQSYGSVIPYHLFQDQALNLDNGTLLKDPGKNYSKHYNRPGYFNHELFLTNCAAKPRYNISGCPLKVRASYHTPVPNLSSGADIELVIE